MTNAVGKLGQPWPSPAGTRAVTLPDSGAGAPTALAPRAGKMKPESFSVSACASSLATSLASPPTRSSRHSRSQPWGSGASSSPATSKAAICCPVRTLRSRPGDADVWPHDVRERRFRRRGIDLEHCDDVERRGLHGARHVDDLAVAAAPAAGAGGGGSPAASAVAAWATPPARGGPALPAPSLRPPALG